MVMTIRLKITIICGETDTRRPTLLRGVHNHPHAHTTQTSREPSDPVLLVRPQPQGHGASWGCLTAQFFGGKGVRLRP